MHRPAGSSVPPPAPPDVTDAVRLQILATEHWSLLATRSTVWNELFSRTGMYLTVLSGSVVALALVSQATDFDEEFRILSLLMLPVVLAVGLGTFLRLSAANNEDIGLVIGMNRLRHAYLEIAPDLEPYFVTGHHDDHAGIMRTYAVDAEVRPSRVLSSTPVLVGVIDAVVAGVLAALLTQTFGGTDVVGVGVGVVVTLATAAALFLIPLREIARFRTAHTPHFPEQVEGVNRGGEDASS